MNNCACALLALLFYFSSQGQVNPGPVAKYTFNDGNARDEAGKQDAKAVGVSFVEDRFGNPRSACYLHGNYGSYLNLGTDPVLKPVAGSISLWIKFENIMFNGRGVQFNPILITKNDTGQDFFEAYYLGIDMNTKRLNAATSQGELRQIALFSSTPLSLRQWHHIVMAYDDNFLCLYLDNALEARVAKNFRTHFLETDSVMVGNSASTKNKRFSNAAVDDIEIYNRVLTPAEVNALYNAPDPNRYHQLFKNIFYALLVVLGLSVVIWLVSLKFKKKLEKEKEKNRLLNERYEMEMRVIKAQMNPHFIFNSLNSIQQLIITDEKEKAQLYLSKFARLIRKLLESNTSESITLADEIELLHKYLEIESLRFSHAFSYSISCHENLQAAGILIPHLLIQPFVENAIWHGLLPSKGDKRLSVHFRRIDEKTLSCIIEDNGIGRKNQKPEEPMIKKKSLAINFIQQRLELMSKLRSAKYGVEITDISKEGAMAGTRVTITLPILNNSYAAGDIDR